MIINDLYNNKKQDVDEGRFVKGPGGVPLDRQGRPVAPKAEPMRMRQWVVHHEGQRGEGGEMTVDAPNLETAWELANEYDLDIIDIKPAKGVSEGSKMARADKSAKAPKPKDQQEYDAVEKYRKDLAQSYNKEPNFGIKDDEEENKWWIDYDLDEGMAEGSLEEVSQQTLQSYRKKASAQKRAADDVVSGDADDETWKKNVSLSAKRRQGIDAANKRLGVAEGSGPQVGDAVYYGKRLVGWFKGYSEHGKIITEPNYEEMGDEYANRDVYWDPQDKITIRPEQGVAENIADDMAAMAQKKFPTAYISKDGQEVQKPENWGKKYVPPAAAPADLEKQQRDLTAKYPNIDELVRRAELNRDSDYEMADGEAYYAARDAEQNYQKLRQIQRVIQGLNESLQRTQP